MCVAAGSLSQSEADYLLRGIEFGFDFDLDESKIPTGYRPNYRSAFENKSKVTDALRKRVLSGKTLRLGAWNAKDPLPTAPISPVGAFEASPENMVAPAGQAAVPIVRPQAAVAPSMALPPGWSTHMTTSANGGRSRRFYVHSSGKKLYSMPEVLRFNLMSPPRSSFSPEVLARA